MSEPLRIEYMPLRELKRYPRNPKDHDLGLILSSIRRFGFKEPMAIDEGTGFLYAGHGRLDDLEEMRDDGDAVPDHIEDRGDDWYAPVVRGSRFSSDDEFRAYVIASNRTVEAGGWLPEVLLSELTYLAEHNVALDGVGYDGDDIDAMIAAAHFDDEIPEEPEAPPLEEKPKTVRYGVLVSMDSLEDEQWMIDRMAEDMPGFYADRITRLSEVA